MTPQHTAAQSTSTSVAQVNEIHFYSSAAEASDGTDNEMSSLPKHTTQLTTSNTLTNPSTAALQDTLPQPIIFKNQSPQTRHMLVMQHRGTAVDLVQVSARILQHTTRIQARHTTTATHSRATNYTLTLNLLKHQHHLPQHVASHPSHSPGHTCSAAAAGACGGSSCGCAAR